ncbi:hypothetical protein NEMIN01_1105 [Nematocida minor]|uniref:uncharacterized protein n=1 Tax=Nematocida minor TaxID=1912983 RepID=UPI002220B24A|nr:uncharacterized protein NEMIN01_1105 [Nematocida minor]KAI5190567.1 hypothetical protein NEMIN01_1105 [Nematocida minor]
MKLSYREDSRVQNAIGKSEKMFFRGLVDENGFYEKEESVKISDIIENYGDFTIKAEKNGTVAIVSIKIHLKQNEHPKEESERAEQTDLVLEGERCSVDVSAAVIRDTGSVQEIIQACLSVAQQKMSVPDVKKLFGTKKSVSYDIFRQMETKRNQNTKTATYGSVEESFYISPILQERSASDAVVTITSSGESITRVEMEQGAIAPSVLQKIIHFHLMH